ncbi:MAG: hypothetical protein ACFFD1_07860, partial [Candidatus Thorarchaeota archaeon]
SKVNKPYFYLNTCERLILAVLCEYSLSDDTQVLCHNCTDKNCYIKNARNIVVNDFSEYHPKYYQGVKAFRYLSVIASSLDSSTLGEPEILGQFKRAYIEQKDKGQLFGKLEELVNFAYRIGKRVHHYSDLPKGKISIISNADETIKSWIAGQNNGHKVNIAIIGTGKMGKDALNYFKGEAKYNISLFTRNRTESQILTDFSILNYQNYQKYLEKINDYHITIFCSNTEHPFFTNDVLNKFYAFNNPMLILDLGMPRNCVITNNHSNLIQILQLEELVKLSENNYNQRLEKLPSAYKIIDSEVEHINKIYAERRRSTFISDLRHDMQLVAEKRLDNIKNYDIDSKSFGKWYNNTVKELMHISQKHLENVLEMQDNLDKLDKN